MRYEAAKCAKSIKQELKKRWPAVKFSVKSDNYSGGNSVDIHWELGPTDRQVSKVTKKYQGGSFDGMTDSYTYSKTGTEFSAKYVHTHRDTPRAVYEQLCRDYAALLGEPIPDGTPVYNHRMQAQGDSITTLANRLLSSFDLPRGYQGVVHAKGEDGNEKLGAGFLEEFYELVGGVRIDREA